MNKKFLFCLVFSFFILNLKSQNENAKWFVGHQDEGMTYEKPDTGINLEYGMTILNFNSDGTISKTRHAKSLGMIGNVINFCDTAGNLLFYSNGSKVFNFEHKLIEGADSLNYSKYWTNNTKQGVFGNYLIGSYPYSMIAFRNPSNPNQYYLVSTIMNYDSIAQTKWLQFNKVVYSILDMNLNNGRGKMIVKEKTLLYGIFSHAIAACKHANGNDWWISAREYNNTNCYHFFKLDTGGIRYDHKQCIGLNYLDRFPDSVHGSFGQIYSHDGSKFAISSQRGIELFDFDRKLGKLSNARFAPRPYTAYLYKEYQMGDVFFSPDNNLLYLNLGGEHKPPYLAKVYQYDTRKKFHESGEIVAIYDGFKDHYKNDTNFGGVPTTFFTTQLAPNGKIYIGTGATTRYMHEIEFPNVRGVRCNIKQHSVKLLTIGAGLPNFPNYSLGAIDDSCKEIDLGAWGTDSSIYGMDSFAEYQWLYCDSGYKAVPNANMRVYLHPQDGLYAARVKCGKTIDTTKCYYYFKRRSGIASNSLGDIRIYPNPASDFVNISMSNVIPPPATAPLSFGEAGRGITLTNLLGQSLSPPVTPANLSGSQHYEAGISLDVRSLTEGIYILQIRDKNDNLIKTERIVIQRDQ